MAQAYVDAVLVPELRPGDIVTMDNLRPHKAPGLREAIEAAGVELLFLPPDSSDFNPIELAFSKLKAHLRKIAARPRDGLWDAVAAAIETVTPQHRQNFIA